MILNGKYRVIDAHCHIYPEKIAERAVHGTSTFYNEPFACKGTVADLFAQNEKAGIDLSVVQSVATSPKQVHSINEFIAREVEQSGGKLVGLGTMHPDSEDPEGDIEHLRELGLKGVKLHPDIQRFEMDDRRCRTIYELCEKKGLILLMHAGDNRYDYSNPNRLLPILKSYRGLTVIGAHFGGWSIWEEACRQLAGQPNLYVDCSSSLPYLSSETAGKIIEAYGADRVLFGTDYPMWSPKNEIELFLKIGLSDEDNRKILSENAENLLGLKK